MPDTWEFPVYTDLPFGLSHGGDSTAVSHDDESTSVSHDDEGTSLTDWPGYMELVDATELRTLRAAADAARDLVQGLCIPVSIPEIGRRISVLRRILDDLREEGDLRERGELHV